MKRMISEDEKYVNNFKEVYKNDRSAASNNDRTVLQLCAESAFQGLQDLFSEVYSKFIN